MEMNQPRSPPLEDGFANTQLDDSGEDSITPQGVPPIAITSDSAAQQGPIFPDPLIAATAPVVLSQRDRQMQINVDLATSSAQATAERLGHLVFRRKADAKHISHAQYHYSLHGEIQNKSI
jgi:hypothetical protein